MGNESSGMDPSRLFKCRVLVVEDDPLVLQTTAAIVHSFGFSVRTAEDGFVALKILREVLPDIILCDLRMPGMSGFELLSIVRRRFPHIPTIAVSGEYILASMPLGLLVDHFFQKGGYTPEQLLAKIKELIADSPVRPHLGKADPAPLWIPRKNADYIVVTCPECLRSSSIGDSAITADVHETDCMSCGATIRYLVDSSVLRALEHKKKLVPASDSSAGIA
jgi:CheY-like chemotaxis protein/ribosomal protein S27E